MWSQWYIVDCSSSHIKNTSVGKTDNVLLNSCHSRLSFLILNVVRGKNFVYWRNNITKNIVPRDDVRVGRISVDNNKLVLVLIVPQNFISPIGYQLQMMICFGCRSKEIYLSILMLKDDFCSVLVREHSQNWVIRFMLHNDIFVLNMVKFKLWIVIKAD